MKMKVVQKVGLKVGVFITWQQGKITRVISLWMETPWTKILHFDTGHIHNHQQYNENNTKNLVYFPDLFDWLSQYHSVTIVTV